jgi:eukaryotic-like serine/threonine-protein kinase
MSTPRAGQRAERRSAGDGNHELRNYKVGERLGQEELATVYRARHLTLDRPVQLHILRRHDWISASRFQLAGRLAARLSHPYLLPVIDAGHDDRYGDYLVTPQIEAQPLSAILADGPVEPVVATRIITNIASVLDYLHGSQIFHRDVQPMNILVSADGVAYLTNLSLAAGPDAPDLSSIDEADYLTPYSAPEQRLAQGEAGAALDIYSLGAVAYHMLSGQVPPAPGADLPSLALNDAGLAPADRVVRRMLAPQPGARFPTATAAATALRQALRTQIDHATEDMEESRWEASAEWLENPLETVLGGNLDAQFSEFVTATRKRADELHRRDVIRRHLNRWSRAGFFRRRALGQLIQPEQIVSYNIYFYELRTVFEMRTDPAVRQRPAQTDDRSQMQALPPDLWSIPVPAEDLFTTVRPQELAIPGSLRVFTCTECSGGAQIPCAACKGVGTIERQRKVSNRSGEQSTETIPVACSTCRGYGKQKCPKCEGTGNLAEEQVFTWSRRAKLFGNTDDIEDLPELAIKQRLQLVFEGSIDPLDGRWHSVAPLGELLRAAIAEAGPDTRLLAAELKIQGAPITEVDLLLDEKPQRIYIVGHDNELIGDWALLNTERLVLAGVAVLLALVVIIAVAFALLG